MIVETQYGEFTLRYFTDACIDEGLEAKNENNEIVILYGAYMPDPKKTHDIKNIVSKIEDLYESQFFS